MAAEGTAKVVTAALAATGIIAVATLAAAAATGASVLLAAAIQALVAASSLALLHAGLRRAARPADAAHPFGYAKEIAFWSFVVAILLFALGAGVAIHDGVTKLVDPRRLAVPSWSFAVLAAALALALPVAAQARAAWQRRRPSGSASTTLRDLNDPALASAVIQTAAGVAGLVLTGLALGTTWLTGTSAADGYGAIAVGLLLAGTAALMSVEVRALIIGEAASPAVLHDVRAAIAAERGAGRTVGAINEIRSLELGPGDILVAASVDFEDTASAAAIEAATSRIETTIKARHPSVRRFFMEGQSARDHLRAEQASSGATPAKETTAPSPRHDAASAHASRAPATASTPPEPVSRPAAAPPSQLAAPAAAGTVSAPPASLPQRESRKGRKRHKGKRR